MTCNRITRRFGIEGTRTGILIESVTDRRAFPANTARGPLLCKVPLNLRVAVEAFAVMWLEAGVFAMATDPVAAACVARASPSDSAFQCYDVPNLADIMTLVGHHAYTPSVRSFFSIDSR